MRIIKSQNNSGTLENILAQKTYKVKDCENIIFS